MPLLLHRLTLTADRRLMSYAHVATRDARR